MASKMGVTPQACAGRTGWLLLLLVAMLSMSGCASMKAKFKKTETFDLAPFAKQTTEMVRTLHYDVSDRQALYLRGMRKFIGAQQAESYLALNAEIALLLKSVVAYSVGVVEISEKDISATEKNAALAHMILRLSEHIDNKAGAPFGAADTQQFIQKHLANIRRGHTYLEGLRNAQPLVDAVNHYAQGLLDRLDSEQDRLVGLFDQAIDEKFKAQIEFLDVLRDAERRHYRALILLSRYRDTHDAALLKEIRALNLYSIDAVLSRKGVLSRRDTLKMYGEISESLDMLERNRDQLRPMLTRYYKSRLELSKILSLRRSAIKDARLSFMLWSRAHAKMAGGKMKPAEWYDVDATVGMLFGAAERAAGLR